MLPGFNFFGTLWVPGLPRSLFLELWSVLSFGPYFFVSVCLLHGNTALLYSTGWATHIAVLWLCLWQRGPRWNNAACSALHLLSVTCLTTHKQSGPFWCWYLEGWICVHSRTLWVSTCDAGSFSCHHNPHMSFQSAVLRLISPHWSPVLCGLSCSPVVPPGFSACKCGTAPSASHPLTTHSLCPGCPSPPLLPVWVTVSAITLWLLDFHTFWFSGSSGYFLFLNLLLSFFWLWEQAKCI